MTAPDHARDTAAHIGQRISQFRDLAGMSQAELAAAVGKSRPNISNIEQGKQDIPTTLLVAIADALRVHASYLLPGNPSVVDLHKENASLRRRLNRIRRAVAEDAEEDR